MNGRVVRFRGEKRRPDLVKAHMKDAARMIALGLAGAIPLEAAVVEAFLALNAAHAEVLKGQLERETA